MKMVNKILLGLAAGAVMLSLVGCGPKDDPEGAIKGSGNNYQVDYKNPSKVAKDYYRAYKATALEHSGALVKLNFENPTECGNSKMGVIFDYKKSTAENAPKGGHDFFIIGVGANNALYVSKFENIVNIQDPNFGAPTDGTVGKNGEKETEYIPLNNGNFNLSAATVDGNISLYVYCKADTNGNYNFALLSGEPTDTTKKMKIDDIDIDNLPAGVKKLAITATTKNNCTVTNNVGKIPNAIPVVKKESQIQQNPLAVYAMIDADKTLKGNWKFCGTYLEAEEIDY